MQRFKVGDSVVHLSHGVGVVKGIERRTFPNGEQEFYILEIQDNGAPKKVFVPLESADKRIRTIVKTKDVDALYEILIENTKAGKGTGELFGDTWNRRYRAYMEEIHSGNIVAIAKVFTSLWHLQAAKDLSFGERKLLDQAKTLLVKELAVAEGISEAAVELKINNIMVHEYKM